ncbi:TetR/AcrR family transcriptional regulator [Lactobacillus amylovorus]|uniref:TetR/AcrR family transcriptional regulator n=1 Tax=Lactobacillus amylovorus TaxID=1604 RepID=A0A9X4AAV7_LACAM|nr:TetR/AcrR family transcriptional regulator [Lactobacillus amylovorus]MDB6254200.1 TetR/AcrR family transcriptional regulator [Lactobacillus amylovorus]MDB6258372.1 TetR/AcrR family transcriptional regulator [Lactobacillus amylovorus]
MVEYGYELFNDGGFSNITMNKIAKAGHFSIMSVYYAFNSKDDLENEILSIALGIFKSKLSYKTVSSVSNLNSRLLAAFKEVPGLLHEVIYNNEVVINRLTSIIAPLLADSVHTDIRTDLFLVCSTMSLTQNIDLKIKSQKMLKIIESMTKNLNPILCPDDNEPEKLQA